MWSVPGYAGKRGGSHLKKYQIIYADPPWQYKVYSKKGQGRSAESHYPTMALEDIKRLPVRQLASSDCALFLWTTVPCYRIVSLSWKPGAFSIKLWPLCGSRKIRKPIPSFGAWGTGQGRMRSFVCWPPSGGQNAVPPVSTRSY